MASEHSLKGLSVLLVEDEAFVSMLAEDALLDSGCTVLLAMRFKEALELARDAALDLAILDVNLGGGETSYPIADILVSRDIPFIFVSGYSPEGLYLRYPQSAVVQKPYTPTHMLEVAAQVACLHQRRV